MKIAVVANSAWYLYNFRRRLMQALRDDGHDVVAISPTDAYAQKLQTDGFEWTEWPLAAAGTNPWRELRAVADLRRALARGWSTWPSPTRPRPTSTPDSLRVACPWSTCPTFPAWGGHSSSAAC
jgi:hypothetical protein